MTNTSTQTRVTVVNQKSPNSSHPNNTACTRFPGETVRKGLARVSSALIQGSFHPAEKAAWRWGRSGCRRRLESPQGRLRRDKNPKSEGKPVQGTGPSSRQTVTRDTSLPPQKRIDTHGK